MIFHIALVYSIFWGAITSPISAETLEPRIDSLHITSAIRSRFATTLTTSRILNPADRDQDVTFKVTLPEAAFISNFTMEIDGKVIVGDVKEKQKAKDQYDAAKERGESAGLVSQRPRRTNEFDIAVNVAAKDKVTFNLTYQEVLKRTHGLYKHVININQDQDIEDLKIEVFLEEKGEIINLRVPKIGSKLKETSNQDLLAAKDASNVNIDKIVTSDGSSVQVTYEPSSSELKQLKEGAQFVLLYDVKRDLSGGQIDVVDGYFVHFFAPEGLPVGKKDVVFILDTSGSMSGDKIEQLKDAMKQILSDLQVKDRFDIVRFSTDVESWNNEPVSASSSKKSDAEDYVIAFTADGSTNIHGALEKGIEILKSRKSDSLASMIIFLTDGLPTEGETDPDIILGDFNKWNKNSDFHIHSISFGSDADFDLLRKLSTQNGGIARKIFIDSDAALQLQGFYNEIASPMLAHLKVKYLDETVDADSIVQDGGSTYYDGSESVIVGRLNPNVVKNPDDEISLKGEVSGISSSGSSKDFDLGVKLHCWDICPVPLHSKVVRAKRTVIFPPCRIRCPPPPTEPPQKDYVPLPPYSVGGFVERTWAYLTIKKLLEQSKFNEGNENKQEQLRKKALDLSLKYNFVTELTSMVVTKDGSEEETELHEKPEEDRSQSGLPLPSAPFSGLAGPAGRPAPPFRGFKGGKDKSPAEAGDSDDDELEEEATKEEEPLTTTMRPDNRSSSGGGAFGSSDKATALAGILPIPVATEEAENKKVKNNNKSLSYRTGPEDLWDESIGAFEEKTASNREQCARFCSENKLCVAALYTPKDRKCKLGKQKTPSCSLSQASVATTKPVVLYCIS